jgi:hypothetical protein
MWMSRSQDHIGCTTCGHQVMPGLGAYKAYSDPTSTHEAEHEERTPPKLTTGGVLSGLPGDRPSALDVARSL